MTRDEMLISVVKDYITRIDDIFAPFDGYMDRPECRNICKIRNDAIKAVIAAAKEIALRKNI